MHRGYIALYRKLQDHPFYKEKRVFSKYEAWIDILWEVQHSEKLIDVVLGMKILKCGYGESLNSLKTWSDKWNWSPSKVKRYFKLLENMKQISTTNEIITTRLKVLNYELYDPKRNANKTQTDLKRNASDFKVVTDKNVNNLNNENTPEKFPVGSVELKLSKYLYNHMLKNNKEAKKPNFQKWSEHIDKMIRLDKRSSESIKEIIEWSQRVSDFYFKIILSTESLRKHYDAMLLKKNGSNYQNSQTQSGSHSSQSTDNHNNIAKRSQERHDEEMRKKKLLKGSEDKQDG